MEHCLREDLNETAQRMMAVTRPVRLTITNYPEGKTETVTVENNPVDPNSGTREVAFPATSGLRRMTSWRPLCPSISACSLAGLSAA